MIVAKVLEELENFRDLKYREFNSRIVATKQKVLGVRMAQLRKIAKNLTKEDWIEYTNEEKRGVFELILIEGLILSYVKKDFKYKVPFFENYFKKVDSWAQIDSPIISLHLKDDELSNAWKVITSWVKSDFEFKARAGLVLALSSFVQSENKDRDRNVLADKIFNLATSVNSKKYYTQTALAWLIAELAVNSPEATLAFLKKKKLLPKTHNLTIQKIRESYRISAETKKAFDALKNK